MTKLQVGNNVVEVDDSFLKLSLEDQQKTVNEISSQLSSQQQQPNHYDLADVPGAALKNAPADAAAVAGGLVQQGIDQIPTTLQGAGQYVMDNMTPPGQLKQAYKAGVDTLQHFKNAYGSWDQAKASVAEHPVQATLDALTVLPVAKGLGTAGKAGAEAAISKVNPAIEIPHPEVAGNVAKDLTGLTDQGYSMDLKGSKTALAKLHNDYLTEANSLLPHVEDRLGAPVGKLDLVDEAQQGLDNINSGETLPSGLTQDQLQARQALKSSRNLVKSTATPEQIDALDRVVGDTQQGANLVQVQKKIAAIQALRRLGQGGVSQYTDAMSPKAHPWMAGTAGVGALTGNLHLSAPLVGSSVIWAGGRAIDAITGRRVLAAKWLKDNAAKAPASVPTGLEDVIQTKAKMQATAQKAAEDAVAAKAQEAQNAANEKARARHEYQAAQMENKAFDKQQKANQQAAKAKVQDQKGAQGQAQAVPENADATEIDSLGNAVKNKVGRGRVIAQVQVAQQRAIEAAFKAPSLEAKKAILDFEAKAKTEGYRGKLPEQRANRAQLYEETINRVPEGPERDYIRQAIQDLRSPY